MPAPVRAWLMPVSNSVRNAGFARSAGYRVVFSLSGGDADRMNRRKIDHVKTHAFCVIYTIQTFAESRAPEAVALSRTREKFIPCGKESGLAVYNHAGI